MQKRLFVTLTVCISCALLLLACGGASNTNNAPATTAGNANAGKAATNSAAPATTPAASTASAGDKVGVPECDNYLAKYESCVNGKVPVSARAQYETTLAQTRKSWRDLAANPQTKARLAQACKSATEAARQSLTALGCDFSDIDAKHSPTRRQRY
ncbi:MAG TPA: hypothetical protein VJ842_10910 [Pyrinomonadaceae bacterium]|nr:hypothetical protein [Pyrinomonadaceae bacterium]